MYDAEKQKLKDFLTFPEKAYIVAHRNHIKMGGLARMAGVTQATLSKVIHGNGKSARITKFIHDKFDEVLNESEA